MDLWALQSFWNSWEFYMTDSRHMSWHFTSRNQLTFSWISLQNSPLYSTKHDQMNLMHQAQHSISLDTQCYVFVQIINILHYYHWKRKVRVFVMPMFMQLDSCSWPSNHAVVNILFEKRLNCKLSIHHCLCDLPIRNIHLSSIQWLHLRSSEDVGRS